MLEAAVQFLLEELTKTAFSRLHGWWRVRRGESARQAGRIADDLATLRSVEFADLPTNEWTAAVVAADTVVRARELDLSAVLEANADPEEVARRIRASSAAALDRARLGAGSRAATDRLLDEMCRRTVQAVVEDPTFVPRAVVTLLDRVEELRQRVVERPPEAAGTPEAPRIESRYLSHVADVYERAEIYGLDLLARATSQSMLETYVGLAVIRSQEGPDGADSADEATDLTGAGLPAGAVLAEQPRILLRGSAGSGKSTLLRRFVLAVALGEEGWTPPGTTWVPFLVELRRVVNEALPAPTAFAELTVPLLADAVPVGWVDATLAAGRGIVLVDGLDEVTPDRRAEVRTWLIQLGRLYPAARFVITTRRSTVPADWLAEGGFVQYDLQPMTVDGISSFIERWHAAYLAALAQEGPGELDAERWESRRERLYRALHRRADLRALAETPLLCGLMCLLNHHYNTTLPARRADLYESALRLLLAEWDERRDVRPEEPPLNPDERRVLLERIAYGLVRGERDGLDRAQAARRIAHETRGMASRPRDDDPAGHLAAWSGEVLTWLLERSSLLREPVPGVVEFAHNSLRDYLAAREFVDKLELDELIEHAHLVRWRDVVLMAMSFARPHERVELLEGLLRGNEVSARDEAVRRQLEFVAAGCLRESPSILQQDSGDEVRDRVLAMIRERIPPKSRDEAELLARAGPVVIDLLPAPEDVADEHRPFVARTLAMLGGPTALARLAELGPSRYPAVADDLLNAWRTVDDPAEYARTVLADVDFGERTVNVRNPDRIRNLVHLRGARVIACVGNGNPVEAAAAMPAVHTLAVRRNNTLRRLEPLRGNDTLRRLMLIQCDVLRDLGALAEAAVDDLEITDCLRVDLQGLAGSPVRRLELGNRSFDVVLRALPAELPALEHLTIANDPAHRTLTGAPSWPRLGTVRLRGTVSFEEADALARLPSLTAVSVDIEPAPDAARRLAESGMCLEVRGGERLTTVS